MSPPDSHPFVLHPAMAGRYTGYLLGRLGLFAAASFSEQLASLGLDRRSWGVLNALDNDDGFRTQQQLGQESSIHPSTMVATIDELEGDGLVERRPHPSDRRAHAVYLTPAGRSTLDRARSLAGRAQRELLAPLDPDERETLHALLQKLAEGVAERSVGGEPSVGGERESPGA